MPAAQDIIAAIKAGNLTAVSTLVDADASLAAAQAEGGVSAVLLAAYYGHRDIAEYLAQRVELTIFEAAALGKRERVQALLEADPALINTYSADGYPPLGLAAFFGHAEVAHLLLEMGADINAASRNAMRVMPLHAAVANQRADIARDLLAHGALVNATQQDDFTPLHAAAQNGQVEMIRLLMAHGADVNLRLPSGETPVDIALKHNHPQAADEMRRLAHSPAVMNHLAIAVQDMEAALAFYRDALGLRVERVEEVPTEKVRVAFLPLGDSEIELMQPTEEGTGITKWMAKHGAGMHHVCLQVPDIRATLARLAAHGAELINPLPVLKPDGTLYAFIHPRSAFGVLVELYQRP